VLELDNGTRGPQPRAQLITRHKLPGVFKQQRQNLEGLPRQADRYSILEKLPVRQVRFERPEPEDSRVLRVCCHRSLTRPVPSSQASIWLCICEYPQAMRCSIYLICQRLFGRKAN
jgi:hypothetical protein